MEFDLQLFLVLESMFLPEGFLFAFNWNIHSYKFISFFIS